MMAMLFKYSEKKKIDQFVNEERLPRGWKRERYWLL